MLYAPARAAFALLAALACGALAPSARAQAPAPKEAPATVEGRVTDGERGLAGVHVSLIAQEPNSRTRLIARAKTDHEGRYRLTGAPPGAYHVLPLAPVYVLPDSHTYPPGRRVTLAAGETVGDVDFRLTRGGVITGRVTDADGQPVIGEIVHITPADASQSGRISYVAQRNVTDDRGVYRVYGIEPGRYRVSVGQDAETSGGHGRGRYYWRTFYPDAAAASEARVVEVTSGGEATDIDIRLGRPVKTYTATGRFVGHDGRPAPGVKFAYGRVDRDGGYPGGYESGLTTGARGEFRLDGLVPGRYSVFAATDEGATSEFYSDPFAFDLDESDVSGLEVKLRRGAAVSGVVQIEGARDRAPLVRLLRQLRLYAQTETGAPGPPSYAQSPVADDGNFRLAGLRPGKLHLGLGWPQVPGLVLSRIELNGVALREGFEVAEGAQVSGVRVVALYGNSVVRGQINVTNGTLETGTRLVVFAQRAGEDPRAGGYAKGAEADARGRFVMEGVAAGDYEFTARSFTRRGARHQSPRVHVAVPESGEATVTLTIDLSVAGDKDDK